jgi:hypothetical protein
VDSVDALEDGGNLFGGRSVVDLQLGDQVHQAKAEASSRKGLGERGIHPASAVAAVAPLDAVVGHHGRGRRGLLDESMAEFLDSAEAMTAAPGAGAERYPHPTVGVGGKGSEVGG